MASQPPPVKTRWAPRTELRFGPRHRRSGDSEMDITPMIDVTFLLLIFFLVASRLDPQEAVDMPTAKFGGAVPVRDVVPVILEKEGEGANIYLGPTKDAANMLRPELSEVDKEDRLADYIRLGLEHGLDGSPPKRGVLIKPDQEATYEFTFMVQQAAGRVAQDMGQDVMLYLGVLEEVSE